MSILLIRQYGGDCMVPIELALNLRQYLPTWLRYGEWIIVGILDTAI